MKKFTIYITITAFIIFMLGGGMSFAQSSGNGERSLENSAREITPSWLNADLYKTYKVKEIKEGDKGTQAGEKAEYLEKELGQSLAEDTTTKVKPDLKKKAGGDEEKVVELEDYIPPQEERGFADLNGDGVITVDDRDPIRELMYVYKDDPRYRKECDLDNSGRIDFMDWSVVLALRGTTYNYIDPSNGIPTADTGEDPYTRSRNRPGRRLYDNTVEFYISFGTNYSAPMNKDNLKTVFEGLLTNKDALAPDAAGELDSVLIASIVQDALGESGLSLPVDEIDPQAMEIATILANILNDSTSEQKVMIDGLLAMIDEAQKLEEETNNEELKKATDDFTEMVATVLLAQALPDLLKKGDISNMKSVFEELDMEKEQILREYKDSVRIYYKSLVEELASNIVTLQIKDILSKELTERELENLPTQHIDEIINKIRNQKEKTITEEQILKVEAKYREEYLVPAKRILEENIKTLLQGFTQRLFGVLDGAGLVKENTVEGKPVLNIDLSAR